MLNFICLGSGSSGNCYFLFSEKYAILIDAGIGIRKFKKHLRSIGQGAEKIKAILITHDHADHIKAVGVLANELDIPVYTTRLVHEGINRNYCVSAKLAESNIRYIEKGEPFIIEDLEIMAFEVPHDSSDNVGYTIQKEGMKFCLITDIGHITPIVAEQVKDASYLVLEANHDEDMLMMGPYPEHLKSRIKGSRGHLCNKDAAILLAENASEKLRHVWLCHLSEENNHPELARKTIDSALRNFGVVVGKDFKLDLLKRNIPSEPYALF